MGLVEYAKCSKFHRLYFKKLFGRVPHADDDFIFPLIDELYRFEFDRWADGKFNYNAFSKRNKPKHLKWITNRIIKHFEKY